jgi:predicted heme/steroid binding protein
MSSKTYSTAEVAQHNKAGDAWIIIDGTIYDISKFAALHPGGELLLLAYAGKDVTSEFFALHRTDVLRSHGSRLVIGTVEGAKADSILKASAPGTISLVPFAESSFWQGFKSPYYNESHIRFRKAVRTFIQSKCEPEAAISEDSGKTPSAKLYKEMGEFGLLAARVGPGPHLKYFSQFIKELPAGVKPEEFDYFHELIAHEESVRMGYPGFQDGIGAGFYIGLPPIMHFAKQGIKEKVLKECLLGEKKICLAISEPTAGI